MVFYEVDYALGQKYFVEKNAFLQSINSAIEYVKDMKVLNYEVIIKGQDLFINLDVKVKKNASFQTTISALQEEIEDSCYSLIDVNPTNIKIDIKGTF